MDLIMEICEEKALISFLVAAMVDDGTGFI